MQSNSHTRKTVATILLFTLFSLPSNILLTHGEGGFSPTFDPSVSSAAATVSNPAGSTALFTLTYPPTPLPRNASWTPRTEACVVVAQDTLIVAGGLGTSDIGYSNDVYQWKDSTNQWSANIANSALGFSPRYGHRCIEFGRSVYLIGGVVQGSEASNEVYSSSDLGITWHAREPLPIAMQYPGVIVYSSKLWVIGEREANLEMEMYNSPDPSASDWTRIFYSSVAPQRRIEPVVELMGDKFWLIGGQLDGVGLNDVWDFNPSTSVWTEHLPIPAGAPNCYAGHAMYQGKIAIVGGLTEDLSTETEEALSFDGTSWNRFSQGDMFKVESPMVVTFRDSLLVMGGDRQFQFVYNDIFVSNDKYSKVGWPSASTGSAATASTGSAGGVASTGGGGVASTGGGGSTPTSSGGNGGIITPTGSTGSGNTPHTSTAAAGGGDGASSTGGNAIGGACPNPPCSKASTGAGTNTFVTDTGSSKSNLGLYIAIPVIVVALLIAAGVCMWYRRRGSSDGSPPPPPNKMSDLENQRWKVASNKNVPMPAQQNFYAVPYGQQGGNGGQAHYANNPNQVQRTIVPPLNVQYAGPVAPGANLPPPLVPPECAPQPSVVPGSEPGGAAGGQGGVNGAQNGNGANANGNNANANNANNSQQQNHQSKASKSPQPQQFNFEQKDVGNGNAPGANSSNPAGAAIGLGMLGGGAAGVGAAAAYNSREKKKSTPPIPGSSSNLLPPAAPTHEAWSPSPLDGLYNYDVENGEAEPVAAGVMYGSVPEETNGEIPEAQAEPYIYKYDDDEDENNVDYAAILPLPDPSLRSASGRSDMSNGSNATFFSGDASSSAPLAVAGGVGAGLAAGAVLATPVSAPASSNSGDRSNMYRTRDGPLSSHAMSRVLKSFDIHRDEVVLGKPVGRGGFGTVYKAEYRGVDAAVKVIDLSVTGDILNAFERELSIMCSVHNNRLIQVYGASRDPKQPFICMEWMERGSLFDCIHGHQGGKVNIPPAPIPMPRRLSIAIQIMEALTYMHNCKPPMIHADIKSHNVLISKDWNAKLGDFGFCQMLASANTNSLVSIRSSLHSSKSPQAGGTLAYLAPEALGEEVIPPDTYLDLYAVGVVLWELFSGLVPWQGYTFTQILCQVGMYHKKLPMVPQIPKPIVHILRALFLERQQRPSAKMVLQMLRQIDPDALVERPEIGLAASKAIESTYA